MWKLKTWLAKDQREAREELSQKMNKYNSLVARMGELNRELAALRAVPSVT